ncbi:MAG: protein translocase subunit SecD [Cytophagales bacterium]|nr:protein translocase subunit SecD [Armatimonadota bacterium]
MKPQSLAAIIAALTLLALAFAVGPFAAPNVALFQQFRPKLGLDIQGGARVVLEADTAKLPKGQAWDDNTKRAVKNILEQRVNANGVAEATITPKGVNQFVVELPAVRNEQQILDQLKNTAQLQFYYSPDWKTQRNPLGRYDFTSELDADGKREAISIRDTTANKTIRDQFHIEATLRDLLDKAATKPAEKAVEVPLPENLSKLSAAEGVSQAKLGPEDAKKLTDLSEELTAFEAFLAPPTTQLIMDGSDLSPSSRGGFDPSGTSKAIVELEFNAAGRDKFANFTRDHSQEILMIYLDGRILMAPNIEGPILNGRAQISPFATVKDAKQLADYLNGGALPVPLTIVQQQSVEATLGTEAVRQGFTAGILGLAAVILFMVSYYLLPGAVACLALILYTLFTYAIFVLIPVTFTLPGIAGFILSVGMAVDANILIFERTKEELRDGRPLRLAIESGFKRAFSAIFDSNVCTAATSLLLYSFGTGPVRGFALTLLIGVALSMFTAITVTRTLLLLLVNSGAGRNLGAWGVNRTWQPRFNVVKSRGKFYLISLLIIIPGLVFAIMGGFKPGIDFTGGTEVRLQFPASASVTRTAIEDAIRKQGYEDPAAQIAGNGAVFVRMPRQKEGEVSQAQTDRLVRQLQGQFPGVTRAEYSLIGSSISTELTRNALTSVLFSSLFIVFYLAFRFAIGGFVNGIKFGVAAIIAMLHDVLVLVGVFAILGYFLNWKVDSLFVTAALTVIGFSVHDTIVIFDRIRENLRDSHGREDFGELVSKSINETFARSINTSLTVVLTLVALLIFGGPVIRPLNAALLIGIISGTYSSIFNAAPIVVDWQRRLGSKTMGTATAGAGGGGGSAPVRPAGPVRPAPIAPRSTVNGDTSGGSGGARVYGANSNGGNGSTPPRTSANPALPPIPPGPRPRKRRM